LHLFDINGAIGHLLIETLKKYNSIRTHNYNAILRLICLGNDVQFSKFVNQYAQMWEQLNSKEYSKLHKSISKIEIRMYLIPLEFNTLAQYIATYDDVYNQEIFIPFIKDPLLPKLTPEAYKKGITVKEAMNFKKDWKATDIQSARDRQIQLYLREAIRFMNVKVCKAELIKSSKTYEPFTIYFVYRAEIGSTSYYSKELGLGIQRNIPEMSECYKNSLDGFPIKLK